MRKADKLVTCMLSIVLKSGSLNFLEPSVPVQACKGIALPALLEEQIKTEGFDGSHTMRAEK